MFVFFKKIFFLMIFVFLIPSVYSMEYQRIIKDEVKDKVAAAISAGFSEAIFFKLSPNSKLNNFDDIKLQILDLIKNETLNSLAMYQIKDLEDKDDLKAFANNLVVDILKSLKNKFVIDAELKNRVGSLEKPLVILEEPILDIVKFTALEENALILCVKNAIKGANKPSQTWEKTKKYGNVVVLVLVVVGCWIFYSTVYQGVRNPSTLPKSLNLLFMYGAPLLAFYLTYKVYKQMPDCIKPTTHIVKIWNSIKGDEKK